MALFLFNEKNVTKIPPIKIGRERDIQTLFQDNLQDIINVTFLASEYSTSFGGRIDTLGIDNNGSPVIIEYKRGQNDNVINQALSYLRWLLDHKAEFDLLVQKTGSETTIDWSSPRVICVAESYNKFDLDTVDLLPINIELLKYQVFENNILLVEPATQRKVKLSTNEIFDSEEKQRRQFKEKIQYTINDHLRSANDKTKEIFSTLRERILEIDDTIIEEAKAKYIAYKLTTNFCDIVVMQDSLKIFINMASGDLIDPHSIARDLTKPRPVGHWGNGDYEVKIDSLNDIDKVIDLVKQSYVYNK